MNKKRICFLTWTTYGTWLPGDARGWVDDDKLGVQSRNLKLEQSNKILMKESPCVLSGSQRELVEQTIQDHCDFRDWTLLAVNCRSNHLHIVLECDKEPVKVMQEFKIWCTRRLRESNTENPRRKWWTKSGWVRYVNDEQYLENVLNYVIYGQESP